MLLTYVISKLLLVVNHGDFATLTLLDLSAAFDTINHDILIELIQDTRKSHLFNYEMAVNCLL